MEPRNKQIFLLICLLIIGLASCKTGQKKLEIGDIENIRFTGSDSSGLFLEMGVPIKNNGFRNYTIENIGAEFTVNHFQLGKITSTESLQIPRGSNDIYNIGFRVVEANPLGGMLTLFSLFKKNTLKYEIKGKIKVKTFFRSREFDFYRKGRTGKKKRPGKKPAGRPHQTRPVSE